MRIDIFSSTASQIASEQSAAQIGTQVGTQKAGQSVSSSTEDKATLTSDSTSVGSLVSIALNSPSTRQGLVDSLKQAINNGQYELNPGAIAASMVNEQV
jgi:flagellar biosynthesis anti-sigma factor FlgM